MPSSGNAGEDAGSHRALVTLRSLLTADETLEAWAMEHRLFALTHRRVCIPAQGGRSISLYRPAVGGSRPADTRGQDPKVKTVPPRDTEAATTRVRPTSSDL